MRLYGRRGRLKDLTSVRTEVQNRYSRLCKILDEGLLWSVLITDEVSLRYSIRLRSPLVGVYGTLWFGTEAW